VRHRLASYSQESTRYFNYSKGEVTFIDPCFWAPLSGPHEVWRAAMQAAEGAYLLLLAMGASPQQARSVLPNSLKTELVMTANLREWRHFFKLRTGDGAHPQMREIAKPLLREFQLRIPVIFEDIDNG
jgi:thymidylate synthase (FAD)